MKLTRPFVMVERDVLFDSELTYLEKLVYCILCAFSDNDTRTCYPSYNTIAEKVGCSKKTVIQCVSSLCEKGWIQKKKQHTKNGGHKSNIYFLSKKSENISLPNSQTKTEYTSINSSSENSKLKKQVEYDYKLEKIKEQIDYEYFVENMPDNIYMVDFICRCIPELYNKSSSEDKKLLKEVSSLDILGFLQHIACRNYSDKKNLKAYLKTMFMEYLQTEKLLISTAVYPKI